MLAILNNPAFTDFDKITKVIKKLTDLLHTKLQSNSETSNNMEEPDLDIQDRVISQNQDKVTELTGPPQNSEQPVPTADEIQENEALTTDTLDAAEESKEPTTPTIAEPVIKQKKNGNLTL